MKFLLLLAIFTYNAIVFRYAYVKGQKDANFDRESANIKLQQCNDIITNRGN
jgi:hypothetical protein